MALANLQRGFTALASDSSQVTQLSVRCTSIVCVCTASEIISWDIHVPLKAQAGNLCKKNLRPKSHLQEHK